MTTSGDLQPMKPLTLDSALRYAVVHSWDELMPQTASGSIQIEVPVKPRWPTAVGGK